MSDRKLIQIPNDQVAAVTASITNAARPGEVVFENVEIPGRPIVIRHALIRLTDVTSKLVVHVRRVSNVERERVGAAVWTFCQEFMKTAGIRAESSPSLVERSTQDFVFYDLSSTTAGITRAAVVDVIIKALG